MNNVRLLISVFLLVLINGCKKKEDNLNVKVETYNVYNITQSSATLSGKIVEYGDVGAKNINYGFCWSTQENPISSNNVVTVEPMGAGLSFTLENLIPNTQYYFRVFASDGDITSYGKQLSFKTLALPVLMSDEASNITVNSATISGSVVHDGGNGIISAGMCWAPDTTYGYYGPGRTLDLNDSVLEAPKGSMEFSFNIKGLHAWVQYVYCTYAITNKGTTFGEINYFRTTGDLGESHVIKDVDGNEYYTKTIKNKEWMIDKLKTKHYANNDSIPFESNILAWPDLKKGAYQYINTQVYGENNQITIYNFYAAIETRNVCPAGWHVSTDKDWEGLIDYLGGYNLSGWALFNVLDLPSDLTCWAVSEDKTSAGVFKHLYNYGSPKISLEKNTKYSGLSVICVKD